MTKIKATHTLDTFFLPSKAWPLVKLVILFCTIMTLIYGAVLFQRSDAAYETSVNQGKQNAKRLINTLSDHINQTFLSANLSLKRVVERQYFNELFGNNLPYDILNNFRIWTNESPQISAMMMTDEHGNIKTIYRKDPFRNWMNNNENVANYGFFTAHQHSNNSELLYIGWEGSMTDGHDGFIVLGRRLNKINGRFGGVVLAAIDIDYINHYFNSVISANQTKLVLMTQRYAPLINHISDKHESSLLTNVIGNHDITTRKEDQITIVHEGQSHLSGFDDMLRLFSFKRLDNLGLLLGVVTYGDDIFEDWRVERISDIIYFMLFMVFAICISFFLLMSVKQMQKSRKSEAAAIMASQAKSDFLANMSHELRTPLNAIIGFSEMIGAGYFGKLNSKQNERIQDINHCGTHLLELINDILEFSKGEAGKIELHLEKIHISQLIDESTRVLNEKAKRQKIHISELVPAEIPYIMADARKLKQILLNLLSNALKFTHENGTIEIACGIDESGNFILSVTDTGIGMKEEDIPKALSAFGQVHNDPTAGGTGLGLPLCKMFADLHGGDLIIHSIEDVGTKVTILLPKDKVIWTQQ